MLITAIRQTRPGRLSVILDNGEEIKSTLAVVTDLRLYAGRELDEAQLNELKAGSDANIARERALEMLSRRMFSCRELYDRLTEKGIDERAAAESIEWLQKNNFLDDESYAAALARHYAAKGYGAGRLRSELSRRGIDRQLWDAAIESMPENGDKMDKFISSRLKDPEDRDQIRKVSAALFRRGYSWEQIREALSRHCADAEDYYE